MNGCKIAENECDTFHQKTVRETVIHKFPEQFQ